MFRINTFIYYVIFFLRIIGWEVGGSSEINTDKRNAGTILSILQSTSEQPLLTGDPLV